MYHVTTCALDQGGVEPRLAVSVRPEGHRQYHYTKPPARQVKHYNFPIRNFDGAFYVQVHPLDPEYFAVKVHPTGALLFTPHHSQLTLLQHIIIQSPFLKRPVLFLSDIPKYWLEDDGTMCLRDSHRWRSADTIEWLRIQGLHSVPNSIKADIGDLV